MYNYCRIQGFCNEQTKKQTNFKLLTFLISLIKPRPDSWHHLWMETVPQNLKENYSIVVVYINYEFKVVFLFFSSSWETLHFFSCGVELSKSIKALKKSNRYERRHQTWLRLSGGFKHSLTFALFWAVIRAGKKNMILNLFLFSNQIHWIVLPFLLLVFLPPWSKTIWAPQVFLSIRSKDYL